MHGAFLSLLAFACKYSDDYSEEQESLSKMGCLKICNIIHKRERNRA